MSDSGPHPWLTTIAHRMQPKLPAATAVYFPSPISQPRRQCHSTQNTPRYFVSTHVCSQLLLSRQQLLPRGVLSSRMFCCQCSPLQPKGGMATMFTCCDCPLVCGHLRTCTTSLPSPLFLFAWSPAPRGPVPNRIPPQSPGPGRVLIHSCVQLCISEPGRTRRVCRPLCSQVVTERSQGRVSAAHSLSDLFSRTHGVCFFPKTHT